VSHTTEKLAYIALSSIIVTGIVSYIYMPDTVWAGAGITAAVTGMVSMVHIKLLNPSEENQIESSQTWLMLSVIIIGIVIVIYNKTAGYSDFYIGMGAGISLVAALTYCIVLFIRFEQSVR